MLKNYMIVGIRYIIEKKERQGALVFTERKIIMRKATREFIKDSDINMEKIEKRLAEIATSIKMSNKKNMTDINIICEEIFGTILNKLYGLNLVSVSMEFSSNFIAVDLIKKKKRVAYQVTSQDKRDKILSTIDKFNKSDLSDKVDQLQFLILSSRKHKYRGADKIPLKNGNDFLFSQHIMSFDKLIKEIANKNRKKSDFLIEVYNCIGMAFDSGRLKYYDIVKESEILLHNEKKDLGEVLPWTNGVGDIQLSAYIPMNYEKKLKCMLQLRSYELSAMTIFLEQDVLLNRYFVSESEFKLLHNLVRYEDEDEMYMDFENVRIKINANTAYHMYELFQELKREFFCRQDEIKKIIGVVGLEKCDNKYILMTIDIDQWGEILYFASNHEWRGYDNAMEWNIFRIVDETDQLFLLSNMYYENAGDIMAKLSICKNKNSHKKLDLCWEPGSKINEDCMKGFDNKIKWKADYTKEWIENKLLKKAHEYYKNNKRRRCIFYRLFK